MKRILLRTNGALALAIMLLTSDGSFTVLAQQPNSPRKHVAIEEENLATSKVWMPRLEDFFQSEPSSDLDIRMSPDGQLGAYTRQVPLGVGNQPDNPYFYSMMSDVKPRRNIWVVSASGNNPVNITNAERDGAGFWAPQWSPTGAFLTMLSTRGGSIKRWVWERQSKRLYPISNAEAAVNEECVWLSNTRLFFLSPIATAFPIPPTTRALVAADLGINATDVPVSVLESGTEYRVNQPEVKLLYPSEQRILFMLRV